MVQLIVNKHYIDAAYNHIQTFMHRNSFIFIYLRALWISTLVQIYDRHHRDENVDLYSLKNIFIDQIHKSLKNKREGEGLYWTDSEWTILLKTSIFLMLHTDADPNLYVTGLVLSSFTKELCEGTHLYILLKSITEIKICFVILWNSFSLTNYKNLIWVIFSWI